MILIADDINKEAVEILKNEFGAQFEPEITREELLEKAPEITALIVRSRTKADREFIEKASGLKLIVRAGVGLDNIDLEEAGKKGVKVFNTAECSGINVAEHTVALILGLLKNICRHNQKMCLGEWSKKIGAGELHGKTVGLIGFGNIGSGVAGLLRPFGARIMIFKRTPVETEFILVKELGELLKESDIISLHVPLTEKTKDMLSHKEFAMMKDGVYIVNTARGAVINEDALLENLKSGKVAGAGLDVFWEEPYCGELSKMENVILTPHVASQTPECKERTGKEIVRIVKEEQ